MLIPLVLIVLIMVPIYLMVVVFFPIFKEAPLKQREGDKEERPVPDNRETVEFEVDGDRISAWLYLPEEQQTKLPCVIMSHGFGGTQDGLMEKYALRWTEAGIAALSYDYRHFGQSQGSPRQFFSAEKQEEDLRRAIQHVRERQEIDPEKIVLFGTSAGGGYGLVIAAEDPRIAGVIGQCPALDKDIDSKRALERDGWAFYLKLFVHAQRDRGRSRLGLSPHYIKIVGRPGETAMLVAPGAFEGYQSLLSEASKFENRVCAQVLFTGQGANPSDYADQVTCPTLLLACEKDNLVSMAAVEKVKNRMGQGCQVKRYPIGHFEIYEGEDFEHAMEDMLEFIHTI